MTFKAKYFPVDDFSLTKYTEANPPFPTRFARWKSAKPNVFVVSVLCISYADKAWAVLFILVVTFVKLLSATVDEAAWAVWGVADIERVFVAPFRLNKAEILGSDFVLGEALEMTDAEFIDNMFVDALKSGTKSKASDDCVVWKDRIWDFASPLISCHTYIYSRN